MADREWEKLDGNAPVVRSKGKKYAEIAAAIQRSMTSLQNIVDDTASTAKAMTATRKLAGDVLEDISKALDRYAVAGEALQTYADALDPAITSSAEAATTIGNLEAEMDTARLQQFHAAENVAAVPIDAPPGELADARRVARRADARVGEISGDIEAAKSRWRDAKTAKDTAAGKARTAIEEVVTGPKAHGLEDSTWEKFTDFVAGAYRVFKVICDVAGILAIFLSWVPGLGQVLLALAAVGSIISIIENVVKMMQEGFSWGGLFGIALGLTGLFGGKAIGSIAKYAKARTVVQTSARMTSGAAKAKFGADVLKSSRRVFAQTSGQRVTEVLKSPFVRSSTDKAIAGMLSHGAGKHALKTWQAAKFPFPYKDGFARLALGNDDVIKMSKFFAQTGLVVDDVAANAQSIAYVSAVVTQTVSVTNNVARLGSAVNAGDARGTASAANTIVTQPAGGSWGKITGIPMKLDSWVNG